MGLPRTYVYSPTLMNAPEPVLIRDHPIPLRPTEVVGREGVADVKSNSEEDVVEPTASGLRPCVCLRLNKYGLCAKHNR